MADKYFQCIVTKAPANDQRSIDWFLKDRCKDFVVDFAFADTQIWLRTTGVDAHEIKRRLRDMYRADEIKSVIDVGPDADAHSGLPRNARRLFETGAPSRALLTLPATAAISDSLDAFVGIDGILTQFREAADAFNANLFSNQYLGTTIPQGFLNFLLVGPKGVGKTTLARALAKHLVDLGIVKPGGADITFKAAPSLVGRYIGDSGNNLRACLKKAAGGILILDELDGLLESSSYGREVLKALNTEMGNNPNRPIVIATCYGSRYDAVMAADEGLAGRFANTVHLEPPAHGVLVDMFKAKVESAGLICDDPVFFDRLSALLKKAKEKMQGNFAHGREIDNILSAVMKRRTARQKQEIAKLTPHLERGGKLPAEKQRELRSIRVGDLPDYDASLRAYVASAEAPVRAIQTAGRAAEADGAGKVRQLHPHPRG